MEPHRCTHLGVVHWVGRARLPSQESQCVNTVSIESSWTLLHTKWFGSAIWFPCWPFWPSRRSVSSGIQNAFFGGGAVPTKFRLRRGAFDGFLKKKHPPQKTCLGNLPKEGVLSTILRHVEGDLRHQRAYRALPYGASPPKKTVPPKKTCLAEIPKEGVEP